MADSDDEQEEQVFFTMRCNVGKCRQSITRRGLAACNKFPIIWLHNCPSKNNYRLYHDFIGSTETYRIEIENCSPLAKRALESNYSIMLAFPNSSVSQTPQSQTPLTDESMECSYVIYILLECIQ